MHRMYILSPLCQPGLLNKDPTVCLDGVRPSQEGFSKKVGQITTTAKLLFYILNIHFLSVMLEL